ncbi:MAG: class I SAM-dependent methyltransferase [Thermoplasmata archaeon]
MTRWEEMAERWDAKQGETGDLWHRALIDPALFALIGDPSGLRVLDLAAGNGYVARRLARSAGHVVALDRSRPILEVARRSYRASDREVEYVVGSATDLAMFRAAPFDLGVRDMALDDIDDAARALGEVSRVLTMAGRLVFTIAHSGFDMGDRSSWVIEPAGEPGGRPRISRKVGRVREIFAGKVPWDGPTGTMWSTPSFHRPLPWYVRALPSAGMMIDAIEKPAPDTEFIRSSPQGPGIAEIPLHLAIRALRVR